MIVLCDIYMNIFRQSLKTGLNSKFNLANSVSLKFNAGGYNTWKKKLHWIYATFFI